jgi:3-phenylpropionate/cinnamic acid dioxygenase small subunit
MNQAPVAVWWEIQQFLHYEADLLDERRYDEWVALLDEDIRYWAPIARNLKRDRRSAEFTAPGEVAWFDEGIVTLRQRVKQLSTGYHWIEEPASRVSHLLTNIRVLEAGPDPAAPTTAKVRSRFLVYLNRQQGETAFLVGKRVDTLRRAGGDWRILEREIYLDQSVLNIKALSTFL